MDCEVCTAAGDVWLKVVGSGGGSHQFSHESEHDLALMVRDFLENGSSGADSWYSSDSDSGFSDFIHLAEKIKFYRRAVDQYESDLLSVVHSHLLSMRDKNLLLAKSGHCNASCIRFKLTKLLRNSGYDAAVCGCKWQGANKVPGGDHEYIDVVNYNDDGSSKRLIIDIDFRSHFEIARAVESYDKILKSLPVVYVGSLTKLKELLRVMVDAARSSLKQNNMPLPPWRSLTYLKAKWQSPYQRWMNSEDQTVNSSAPLIHEQCGGHLRMLQSSLQSEVEADGPLKPTSDPNRRLMLGWRSRNSFMRTRSR